MAARHEAEERAKGLAEVYLGHHCLAMADRAILQPMEMRMRVCIVSV
jgi:hypothetical protein